MPGNILRRSDPSGGIAPLGPRLAPLFCLALLAASSVLASFAFACATPFPAYAVIAAAMLPLPPALLVVIAAWLINQAIGFAALGYPRDAHTLLWGVAIGVAALFATFASKALLRIAPRAASPMALALALAGAYATYEIVLFGFTPLLGGAGAFAAAIVVRLGLLNILWLSGLLAVCAACRVVGDVRRRYAAN
jgi:hypothetical protein